MKAKFRQPYSQKAFGADSDYQHVRLPDLSVRRLTRAEAEAVDRLSSEWRVLQTTSLESANPTFGFFYNGRTFTQRWKTNYQGLDRLSKADRLYTATAKLRYLRYVDDFPVIRSLTIGKTLVRADTEIRMCMLSKRSPR